VILVNGVESTSVSTGDRGLNYGDGLFETMRLAVGEIALLDRHLRRLKEGCDRLRMEWPGEACIRAEISTVIRDHQFGIVKLIVTRGSIGRGYRPTDSITPTRIVGLHTLPTYPIAHYSDGVRVRVCKTRLSRNIALGGIKHLGRLEQVLASLEEQDKKIDEGLMLDEDGNVIEGIRSNIFLVRNSALVTPALDYSGVAGVMRAEVLDALKANRSSLQVRPVDLDELLGADEIFLSNSIFGIWGVREIEAYDWRKDVGPVTRELIETFTEMRNSVCES
jgi:4-amino-4-deoxychorismate lyase